MKVFMRHKQILLGSGMMICSFTLCLFSYFSYTEKENLRASKNMQVSENKMHIDSLIRAGVDYESNKDVWENLSAQHAFSPLEISEFKSMFKKAAKQVDVNLSSFSVKERESGLLTTYEDIFDTYTVSFSFQAKNDRDFYTLLSFLTSTVPGSIKLTSFKLSTNAHSYNYPVAGQVDLEWLVFDEGVS